MINKIILRISFIERHLKTRKTTPSWYYVGSFVKPSQHHVNMQVLSGSIGHVVYPSISRANRELLVRDSSLDSLGIGGHAEQQAASYGIDLDQMAASCSPDERKLERKKDSSKLEKLQSLLTAHAHTSKPYRNEFQRNSLRKLVFFQAVEVAAAESRLLKQFRNIRNQSTKILTESKKRKLQNEIQRFWEMVETLKKEIGRYRLPKQDIQRMVAFYKGLQKVLIRLFLQIEAARSIHQTKVVILASMRKIRREANKILDEFILIEVRDQSANFSLKLSGVHFPNTEALSAYSILKKTDQQQDSENLPQAEYHLLPA